MTYRKGKWFNPSGTEVVDAFISTGPGPFFTATWGTVCVINSIHPNVCADTLVVQYSKDYPGMHGSGGLNRRMSW
jgi:hypothetical protein